MNEQKCEVLLCVETGTEWFTHVPEEKAPHFGFDYLVCSDHWLRLNGGEDWAHDVGAKKVDGLKAFYNGPRPIFMAESLARLDQWVVVSELNEQIVTSDPNIANDGDAGKAAEDGRPYFAVTLDLKRRGDGATSQQTFYISHEQARKLGGVLTMIAGPESTESGADPS